MSVMVFLWSCGLGQCGVSQIWGGGGRQASQCWLRNPLQDFSQPSWRLEVWAARWTSVCHLPSALLVKRCFLFWLIIVLVFLFLSVFTSTFGSRFFIYILQMQQGQKGKKKITHLCNISLQSPPKRYGSLLVIKKKKKYSHLRVEAVFSQHWLVDN